MFAKINKAFQEAMTTLQDEWEYNLSAISKDYFGNKRVSVFLDDLRHCKWAKVPN